MHSYPLVTVVGGSGFVGRHVVKLLAAKGYRVRVLARDVVEAEFLKTAGTPGQIDIQYADITRPKTLVGKCAGSQAVVNLVSILYARGRQQFHPINVNGARAVAQEAKKAGATALVHLSALGIEQSAKTTAYGRTKLAGESAVREAFFASTILRPSLIIGPEDGFFQRFGRMSLLSPVLPLIGGGRTKFQPVLVTDVAAAIVASIRSDSARGRTYELAGPAVHSFKELLQQLSKVTKRKLRFVSIPFWIAILQALVAELVSRLSGFPPVLTRDQVRLLKYDCVATGNFPGLQQLGITPTALKAPVRRYLSRFIKE